MHQMKPPNSRQKVAIGDYETASEVVREGLRLLKQRDEVWKADVRDRIKQGTDSIRTGRTIPAEQVQAEMTAFKKVDFAWRQRPSRLPMAPGDTTVGGTPCKGAHTARTGRTDAMGSSTRSLSYHDRPAMAVFMSLPNWSMYAVSEPAGLAPMLSALL
jgi:putative addiction module CopG family antidote